MVMVLSLDLRRDGLEGRAMQRSVQVEINAKGRCPDLLEESPKERTAESPTRTRTLRPSKPEQ